MRVDLPARARRRAWIALVGFERERRPEPSHHARLIGAREELAELDLVRSRSAAPVGDPHPGVERLRRELAPGGTRLGSVRLPVREPALGAREQLRLDAVSALRELAERPEG